MIGIGIANNHLFGIFYLKCSPTCAYTIKYIVIIFVIDYYLMFLLSLTFSF